MITGALGARIGFVLLATCCLAVAQTPTGASRAGEARAQIGAPPPKPAPGTADLTRPAYMPVASINPYQGMRVRRVELVGVRADDKVRKHLLDLIAQKPNEPLDRKKIQASLQRLHATGRFSDIEVDAQPISQNELALVFSAKENLFIGTVRVYGAPRRPSDFQLVDASKLQLGELYTPAKLDRAMQNMKAVLAENGYYEPQIQYTQQRLPERQQIDIRFQVDPGPPAHIGDLYITGDAGYNALQIAEITGLGKGHTVNIDRSTKAVERLRKKYQKQGRLQARIAIVDRRYHSDTDTLDYYFNIQRGPTTDIHITGVKISEKKLQRYIPIYEEHAVDEDLLNEGRRNLRDYLQTQGYFDAQVDYVRDTEPAEDHLHIVYQVERGEKHTLAGIELKGNKYFDEATIRERMQIQPTSWLLSHGRFSQAMLNDDIQAITALYLSNGFEQVKVDAVVRDDIGKPGRMIIEINVQEGPQTLVRNVVIEGNNSIPLEELQNAELLTTFPGQPFSAYNLASDRDAVMNYYFNQGFPDVQFAADATPVLGDPTRRDVTYKITEGQRVFVDHVLISNLEFTKPTIVSRQFRIHDSDPLNQFNMASTQQRLYDLGVFNQVNMAVQNPDGKAAYKNLLFDFSEARRWTLTYGLGLEAQTGLGGSKSSPAGQDVGVSPRVSFDLTRINVGGRAHTLSLKTHVGRVQQRGLLTYDAPRFMRHESLKLTLSAFYDNSLDVRTFTSERLEGSVQMQQVLSRTTLLLYRFTYRRVRASDVVVDPSQIPLLSRPVRVGMPSFSWVRDRRDDVLDTHKGNYTTVDTGLASGWFGSQADFGRVLLQNSTYYPWGKAKRQFVFARNTRVGIAEPFGSTTLIPLPERFFAGGANSLRGFPLNQAGPRDLVTGQPLGGNAVFMNQFELRFPPMALPFVGENLSIVAFHDFGNVFSSAETMVRSLARWQQPQQGFCKAEATASRCRFDYMAQAIGAGVRYHTPIGPVRVDLGYNLTPTVFPVSAQFTPLPAGSPGDAIPIQPVPFRSEQTRRFNFYFSIGQTF